MAHWFAISEKDDSKTKEKKKALHREFIF